MSSTTSLEKYRIEGLDCGQCANDIEIALRKIEGFADATVSFATETVMIPAGQLERAEKIVARVEPEARLVSLAAKDQSSNPGSPDAGTDPAGTAAALPTAPNRIGTWRIVRIGLAIVLTGLGIAFYETLHETPLQIAEYLVFITAYLLVGFPVLRSAVRNIIRGRVFDEMFLMSVATLGAIIIHELPEAVGVMLFYSVGEYVQDLAVGKSRRSISSLMDLRPDSARLVTDEGTVLVKPEVVTVGETIEVLPGERVPLDGEVVEGASSVDTSALTGESVPRTVDIGEPVLSGFVNQSGKLTIRVTKVFSESSVSRILELVENAAARKAPTEKFISRFAAVYTPIMVGIAAAVAFVPPLLVPGATLGEWVYRALVILVISCPCALVISIPLGYFGGIGAASRNGILIKGANFVDALKDVSTVVFDKTGTLTQGVFKVTQIVPRNGHEPEEILRWAAAAESHSTHPIARSIRDEFDSQIDAATVTTVHEERGFGVSAQVDGTPVIVGNDRLLHRENIDHVDCEVEGTVVYVAVDKKYAGYLVIADSVKPEARQAVADLKSMGVRDVVMLTGDSEKIAGRIARETGIEKYYAELLPDEKVARVEALEEHLADGEKLAFAGDGINDAPVLMHSDIGFAMGALGSDAAIEAADIVLMDDRVDAIPRALGIARHTRRIVYQNIGLALFAKAVFLVLGAVGVATMWEAVIADVGVSLLAVLNSTRALRLAGKRESGSTRRIRRPV